MRVLTAVAALVVAACAPSAPAPPAQSASLETPASEPAPAPSADQASCIAKGGEWRPVCRMQQPACVVKFADAGKACTDGDDCAGDCLAKSDAGFVVEGKSVIGSCAVNDDPCGCKQTVENGKATAAICID